jgi:hypothetical protein
MCGDLKSMSEAAQVVKAVRGREEMRYARRKVGPE